MEFVATPTSLCPHVDRVACTNFSPRTVELRRSKSWEIFLFPFLLSPFPFVSLYELFSFLFISSFLFPFCFSFSHPYFFSSHFPSFLLFIFFFLLAFSPPFWSIALIRSKEEISSPFSHAICVVHTFPSLFPYFFISFYDITIMWLIVSHTFKCTTWIFQVSLSWGAMWHPLDLAMCHPTPHTSKNVKSRLPWNPMKFDVIAKFRETISTKKSVSSSKI